MLREQAAAEARRLAVATDGGELAHGVAQAVLLCTHGLGLDLDALLIGQANALWAQRQAAGEFALCRVWVPVHTVPADAVYPVLYFQPPQVQGTANSKK